MPVSAIDTPVTVIVSQNGIKGEPGVDGVNGAGFSAVRKSIIDNPLFWLFKKNHLVSRLSDLLTVERAVGGNYTDIYGAPQNATADEPREEDAGWLITSDETDTFLVNNNIPNLNDGFSCVLELGYYLGNAVSQDIFVVPSTSGDLFTIGTDALGNFIATLQGSDLITYTAVSTVSSAVANIETTNTLAWSGDTSQWGSINGSFVSGVNSQGVDGDNLYIADAAVGQKRFYNAGLGLAVTTGDKITASIDVKGNPSALQDQIRFRFFDSQGFLGSTFIDNQTFAHAGDSVYPISLVKVAEGYTRVSVTFTATRDDAEFDVEFFEADDGDINAAGDGINGNYYGFPQLQKLAWSSVYIETGATAVTQTVYDITAPVETLIATFDGDDLNLYIDNALAGTIPLPTGTTAAMDLTTATINGNFTLNMRGLRFYDIIFNSDEITYLS